MGEISMSKRNFYFASNKDGYTCAFDSVTHKCIDIIESTGDIPLSLEQRKKYLGEIDPQFKEALCQ